LRVMTDGPLAALVRKNSLMNKGLRRAPEAPVKSHQSQVKNEVNTAKGFSVEKSGRLVGFNPIGFH